MKVARIALFTLLIVSTIIISFAIVFSGIDYFINFWWQASFRISLAVFIIAVIIYVILRLRVLRKYKGLVPDYKRLVDLIPTNKFESKVCPECGKEGFHAFTEIDEPLILVCWNCQHIFSFVWCKNSGMGGNFINRIFEEPLSWICPDCNTEYPLPKKIFKNPIQLISYETLPENNKLNFDTWRMQSELNQAATSTWFIASIFFSYYLIEPVLNSLADEIAKLNNQPTIEPGFVFWIITFFSLIFAINAYPLMIVRGYNRLRGYSNDHK